jgi:hypothetical protein
VPPVGNPAGGRRPCPTSPVPSVDLAPVDADAPADGVDRGSAWVVVDGSPHDALIAALARLGVNAEVEHAGDLTVVVPERPVMPEELPGAARSPFAR